MTGNCNRNSGAHVQGGWQLDCEWLSLPGPVGLEHSECPPHGSLYSLAGACLCQCQYPLHGSLLYDDMINFYFY